jgi:hypothetical protein
MMKCMHVRARVSNSTDYRLWMILSCILGMILMAFAMTACAATTTGKKDATASQPTEIADISDAAQIGIYEMNGQAVVLGGEVPYVVDGVIYLTKFDAQYSVHQTEVAFLTNYIEGQGGGLYYASETQYTKIESNVVSFYLSSDGKTIAYLTGPYDEAVGGTLYIYNCVTNKSVWVADHADKTMVLSPSGTSIGYSVISTDASSNIMVTGYYVAESGAPQEVGENSYVTALTDDADIVTILESDSATYTVWALREGKYTQYSSCPAYQGGYTCFVFNRDGTQVMYNKDFSTYSYSQNAAPSQNKVNAMSFGPMEECSFRRLNISENAAAHVMYTSVENLSDIMYMAQSSTSYQMEIIRFDENMNCELEEIEGFVEGKSKDLNRFAYVKNNQSLMLLENPFEEGTTAITLTDDVSLGQIDMASDGTLYYLTNANELYVVRSGNEPLLLKSDVTGMSLVKKDKSSTLFYISDYKEKTSEQKDALGTKKLQFGRTLYSLDNKEGSNPVAIVDYVDSIEGDIYGIVYTTITQITQDKYTCESLRECFYSGDGKSFEKILQIG